MPFNFYGVGTPTQINNQMAAYTPAPADAINQDARAAVFNMAQRLWDTAQGEVPNTVINGVLKVKIHGHASERGWRLHMTAQVVKADSYDQVTSATLPPATLNGATTGP